MGGSFSKRFGIPLTALVLQGATSETLALSLAVGVCVSCFPVPGVTTVLCVILAFALRLNLPALLLANIAAFPLQVLLLFPFARLGERLFQSPHLSLVPSSLLSMLRSDPLQMSRQLWTWQWHAIVAWMLVAPVAGLILTLVLRIPLRRLAMFSGPVTVKRSDNIVSITPPLL